MLLAPRSKRTDTRLPDTTLFHSAVAGHDAFEQLERAVVEGPRRGVPIRRVHLMYRTQQVGIRGSDRIEGVGRDQRSGVQTERLGRARTRYPVGGLTSGDALAQLAPYEPLDVERGVLQQFHRHPQRKLTGAGGNVPEGPTLLPAEHQDRPTPNRHNP